MALSSTPVDSGACSSTGRSGRPMGASGTLLIVSTLNEQGYVDVTAPQIALWSVPIAIISVLAGIAYSLLFDRKLKAHFEKKNGEASK